MCKQVFVIGVILCLLSANVAIAADNTETAPMARIILANSFEQQRVPKIFPGYVFGST